MGAPTAEDYERLEAEKRDLEEKLTEAEKTIEELREQVRNEMESFCGLQKLFFSSIQ